MEKRFKESLDYLKSQTGSVPETGIILGTGLGNLVNDIDIIEEVSYQDIPHFPVSTVEGHHGKLIFGHLSDRNVVAMKGRFHYYEGYSMEEVTYPVRILKLLGIKDIFISNAAGGVNPDFNIGDLMLIHDHISFFPDNPLRGKNMGDFGPRFPDMSRVYDPGLIELAIKTAGKLGIPLHQGVYLGNPGPSFETPAEYIHYQRIGADAIGMSTIPEVIVARHMGLKIFAISVITNVAVKGNFQVNTHEEVQKAAEKAQVDLSSLIGAMLKSMG